MTEYHELMQLLAGNEDFELNTAVVRRDSLDSWVVYLDETYIGRFTQFDEGRATYFKSEVASEPGHTEWVSDNPATLVNRMIDVRD